MDGFTVLEVLIALSLGAMVLGALLATAQALTTSLRQAQALETLSSAARFVHAELEPVVASAGAAADPITNGSIPAVNGSRAGPSSDVLSVQAFSPRNCFDNDNDVRNADGGPAWWLRRNDYAIRDGSRLVRSCFYGPSATSSTRQLNAATLVEGVEALRLRFGLDTDGDRQLDHWSAPGSWTGEHRVIGIRVGLVFATDRPVGAESGPTLDLLGQEHPVPDDGRARFALVLTYPIQGSL